MVPMTLEQLLERAGGRCYTIINLTKWGVKFTLKFGDCSTQGDGEEG